MSNIIDLQSSRKDMDKPEDDHVRKDDFGRPRFRFLLEYEMDGSVWGCDFWAYSMDDAKERVAAMRASLMLVGQVHATESWS